MTKQTLNLKPICLLAESKEFSEEALNILSKAFDVKNEDLDREQLLENLEQVEILWVRLRTLIDASVMNAAPQLKLIATNTTGLNHIDLEEAYRRGIKIASLKGEYEFLSDIRATAEHTIALTLALLRKIPQAHEHTCSGHWDRYLFKGRELYQSTAGIIGYGRLGKIVARYFLAFGMQVLVYDERPVETEPGIKSVSLKDLKNEADIISIHVDLQEKNHNIFSDKFFGSLKKTAVFINTSRGELVDENSLLKALTDGKLSGAALDVVNSEHTETAEKKILLNYAMSNENLILTPHIGGNTFESHHKTEIFLAQKVVRNCHNQ
ncbi:hypothetical protein N9061_00155 [bacterium]|nr:hypothetical protein [bacterium]